MPVHSHLQPQTFNRLLWSGILAAGILWCLALGSLGSNTEYVGKDIGRTAFAAAADMPLHANGETSLALKRFFKRGNNQSSSAEPAHPIWALTASDFIVSLPLVAENQYPVVQSPHICLHQLQTLNAPRAPPLV